MPSSISTGILGTVGKILNTMGDMSSQDTLGGKTNVWASNKTWLVRFG